MNANGGPQWANPEGTPMNSNTNNDVTQHEAQLFAPLSTLDEPIRETIMRDVRSVASKLKVVLLPMERSVSCGLCLTGLCEGRFVLYWCLPLSVDSSLATLYPTCVT